MPHIQPTTSDKGSNTGSCESAVYYLEKENKDEPFFEREDFFNDDYNTILPEEAISEIDHNHKALGKNDAKFYAMTYSFSEAELKGKSDKELKEYVKENFTKDYCNAVKGREIKPETIKYVAKLEEFRYYKGTDEDVKNGIFKQGTPKPGDNRHIHILVARKTTDNKKVSPLSNHRTASKGPVKSGFDRVGFKNDIEKSFDKHFTYDRPKEQTFDYLNAQSKLTDKEKEQQKQALEQVKEQEKEQQKQQEIAQQKEQQKQQAIKQAVGKESQQGIKQENPQEKKESKKTITPQKKKDIGMSGP